jgi:hypothetical protein
MKEDFNENEPAKKSQILEADCLKLYFFLFVTEIAGDKGPYWQQYLNMTSRGASPPPSGLRAQTTKYRAYTKEWCGFKSE